MKINAIGLMSGTSLDGLDICYAEFYETDVWHYNILKSETIPYSKDWENQLRNAIHLKAEDLCQLDSDYGFFLGEQVLAFLEKHKIEKSNIHVIASHGHTVFHQPQKKFTKQIGDGKAIKILTNLPVVYDFRMQDVLMGGNGAPLVPIGDQLLFSNYDACINLGGFSNISFNLNQKRIAFDICPVNLILNEITEKYLQKKYDENGDFAKNGKVIPELLNLLNQLDFYKQTYPKSMGREWVNTEIFPLIKDQNAEDLLATFTEHIAVQISNVLNQYQLKSVLFTGGGSYNAFLIEKIRSKTKTEVLLPNKELTEFKEALIFAFMGVLKLQNKNNVLASSTGSYQDHCSGILV